VPGRDPVHTEEDGLPDTRFPLARPPSRRGPIERLARAPTVRLFIYYLVVVSVTVVLVRAFPEVRAALVDPSIPALGEAAEVISGARGPGPAQPMPQAVVVRAAPWERGLTALFVVLGAIVLSIPVAWVYMWTKRLRYDPGLVRSIIILPIAVSGILLVVKYSLAIAFSLAGIVAAVRFRNTLKDPQDAVYVFLTIAIGISAGVQALDVALVVSIVFNIAVIAMWKRQVGSLNGGGYTEAGTLSVGDTALLVARSRSACQALRREAMERADGLDADGLLLVHFTESESAPHAVQDTLAEAAADWRMLGVYPRGEQVRTAEYLVALAPGVNPVDLMGALDEWSAHLDAAEYVPFRRWRRSRTPEVAEAKGR